MPYNRMIFIIYMIVCMQVYRPDFMPKEETQCINMGALELLIHPFFETYH